MVRFTGSSILLLKNHCRYKRITAEELHISFSAKKLYNTMICKILSQDNVSIKRPVEKIVHDISVNEQNIYKLENRFADGLIDAAERVSAEIKKDNSSKIWTCPGK